MLSHRMDFAITFVSLVAEVALTGSRFAAKAIQITRLNRTFKLIKVKLLARSHGATNNLLAQ